MRRTLEVIFRHPTRLVVLLLMPPLLGMAIALAMPRAYQATATLWALHRYTDISATGPETNLDASPADTQATALAELLQVRTFALKVAKQTNLAATLPADARADPEKRDDALYAEISQHVDVVPQGLNVYTISYTNQNAQLAQRVVAAVIDTFSTESQSLTTTEGKQLLDAYQAQLALAKDAAAAAATAETRYIAAHPTIKPADLPSDPQYALLHAQTQQARDTISVIQGKIDTLNQQISTQGNGAGNLFVPLDDPKAPTRPTPRLKQLLLAGGTGAAVALLLSALYVALLVRRNRTAYTLADLQWIAALHETLAVPVLSHKAVAFVTDPSPPDISR